MKNIKNKKIFIVLSVMIILSLLSVAAVCNTCGSPTETTDTTSEEETTAAGATTSTTARSTTTTDTASDTTADPTSTTDTAAGTTTDEPRVPTIELSIYEGPTYAEVSGVCYYRIKADITGSPIPDVDFSKDDSGGTLGDLKCQVNINNPGDTYTLIAVAKNSEGTDDDSIELTWGCEEEATPDDTFTIDTPEPVFEGHIPFRINPINVGYLVWPTGVNTETVIFGDSTSNQKVQGMFGFGNLSDFSGRTIESVSLELKTHVFWGDPRPELLSDINIVLERRIELFPLSMDVWFGEVGIRKSFAYNQDPIIWSDSDLKNEIQTRINDGRQIDFKLYYFPNFDTDGDYQIDGREYRRQDVALIISFAD